MTMAMPPHPGMARPQSMGMHPSQSMRSGSMVMSNDGMFRSPTFLVGTERQRGIMDEFQKRDQQFSEQYQKNKPLCFSARAYQKTHPAKAKGNHTDADATLAAPMMVGVADGVSQLEEFGMDPAELPNELLRCCEELAMNQLMPGKKVSPSEGYRGPVSLLKEAYEATESLGSTTVILGILDNSTRIHGKLHPMVAVLTIGDCELLMLRRVNPQNGRLKAVFHTEMQRIDGHAQTPLQLARVDGRIDPDFDEDIALEVIERGSAVHCVSAYEGDIVVLGSDGVFDNLFLDEVVDIVNSSLQPTPGHFVPQSPQLLGKIARRIVEESHKKSQRGVAKSMLPDTPIGRGGKMDDTSCVVAEVVEWTEAHSEIWAQRARARQWEKLVTCGGVGNACMPTGIAFKSCGGDDEEIDDFEFRNDMHRVAGGQGRFANPNGYQRGPAFDSDDEEDRCRIL